MNKSLLFFCFLFPGVLQAQVTFNPNDLNTIANGERKSHEQSFRHGHAITTSAFDVKFYRCYWIIDPALRQIAGNVTVYFKPMQAGFDSLVLDMHQALTVEQVIYHQHSISSWSHTADLLTVRFVSNLPQNVIDSVTVVYQGVPPDDGFGTFVQDQHNGNPILWTLSEPYGASNWWPCKNGLTDKADSVDITISTPNPNKTATNGMLVSTSSLGGNTEFHWKHSYPIAAYLVGIAVTNYASFTQKVPFGNDTLKVVNFVYPEDSTNAVAQLPAIIPMIQVYDSLFGIYPFQREKYGHAQFSWGGGMEHQTMTFVANFEFELIAHELGHMWFGDKVTCGSWTDIWLNEGFATYLSGLIYEHLDPSLWVRFRMVRVQSITSMPGGSVYCNDTTNIDRIFDGRLSYAKGAMILHQLRWIMGDSVFFAALNNYLKDYRLAYGFARTEDLKTHLENSYGHDLGWYFNDWFTGEGYPQYRINWSQTADTVAFTVSQTQSSPGVSFFELPIQLLFKNSGHDTLIRFNNTFSGELFKVRIPFPVDSLIFDPQYQIISSNNTVNAVAEHGLQAGLQLVPNPAKDHVTFRFGDLTAGERGNIRIYDDYGRKRDEVFPGHGQSEFDLDTHAYPSGLYFYVFSIRDNTYSGKFIISK
ncbi:MAG: M1 family aminopeptidase [Bacteroidetes bacterium]|nr:M1 family aminopeptidase [Bacteroidota bacterium]